MNKIILLLLVIFYSCSCARMSSKTNMMVQNQTPPKEKLWIFILAGQSNMAGRAAIEPQDTLTNSRVFTLGADNTWQVAQEPLHYYEPKLTGLDCGTSFANELLIHIPADVTIGLVPCAVGGSSVRNWLDDQPYRGVRLLSNFNTKVNATLATGTIKGILWHQGESDNSIEKRKSYLKSIDTLFYQFRTIAKNQDLPILVGEIGDFRSDPTSKSKVEEINALIHQGTQYDKNRYVISTLELKDKGDLLHFDGQSIRELGKRYAKGFIKIK